jgi:hypothetical protein
MWRFWHARRRSCRVLGIAAIVISTLVLFFIVELRPALQQVAVTEKCSMENSAYRKRWLEAVERLKAQKESGVDALIVTGYCPYP